MPPRWPRQPTRQDPAFRKLDDRYTFAAHIAIFVTVASGMEFFNLLWRSEWLWLSPLLSWWFLALGCHFVFIKLARYPATPDYTELDLQEVEGGSESIE